MKKTNKINKLNVLKGVTSIVLAGTIGFLSTSLVGNILSKNFLDKQNDSSKNIETTIDNQEIDTSESVNLLVDSKTDSANSESSNVLEETDRKIDLVPISEYKTDEYTATLCSTATTNVNIRKGPSTDDEILGLLSNGASLVKTGEVDGWNQVLYEGDVAYISNDYSMDSYIYTFNNDMSNKGYINNNTYLYSDSNMSEVISDIPYLEFCEIYGDYDNSYLVNTDYGVGYISKNDISLIDGKLVVVDKSTQTLKYYNDNNELAMITPIVTGSETSSKYTPSDEGLFDIDDKRRETHLKGPTWDAYVDIFMPYNGGEGLHDAEYHTHSDGFSHGWKGHDNFGGNYYTNGFGSHGCINMRHNEAMKLGEELEVGDKVLVKK